MNKPLLITIAIVGMVIAVPILVYATSYAGEYEVTVEFNVEATALGVVSVTEIGVESSAMGMFSLYEMRGHAGTDRSGSYVVFVSITQGDDVETISELANLELDTPETFSFTFYEKQPGESTIRIYIEYVYMFTVVYDYDFVELIG